MEESPHCPPRNQIRHSVRPGIGGKCEDVKSPLLLKVQIEQKSELKGIQVFKKLVL